ncbi:sodium:solute symporter family transporter [Sphingobacterium sp. FBM7-1]|uniref:sodium:solute symporter family transporter n=1 Tax=Sphingobacterium sp. FBM7-1 TaxID=2886688 RepID=UPI001D1209B7|nr:sodium/solute symporter [Sphingobacterium sp. FBM7-1]MCC2600296.1 sodium/solute symporter [Sphingobacterium sp. FBM7-1]
MDIKDYIVFLFYFLIVAGYGLYIYYKKKAKTASSKDYFLAEGSLTWWAIGASIIASNISAEQFIGMSGSGFMMGLAIASYEWMGAAALLVVAIFFLPVYLKNKISTMPEFLSKRYNGTVAMIMAVFWLMLYVVVNLTSILFLGALAVSSVSGLSLTFCMYGLAFFAILITLGGMKVIGYTDVIQVFFLILGGLATTYLALDLVANHYGSNGILEAYGTIVKKAPEHFQMIFRPEDEHYIDLPGLSVLVGGLWVVNLSYWGCNQYITQRALGADLNTARNGLLFAAGIKLVMPIIVVLPGIACYVLYKDGLFQQEMGLGDDINPDRAYPVLLNLLPTGLKGLSFAALTAAVVASLAGKANSVATIFTLDIYKKIINKDADEKRLVDTGKITIIISMILAVLIAPYLGIDKKGGFQYIQEYTGFVSPGIFAMFLLGFFWKKTTSNAALFATIGGFVMSMLLKFLPLLVDLSFLAGIGFAVPTTAGVYEIPFIDRIAIVFVSCIAGMVLISKWDNRRGVVPVGFETDPSMFRTSRSFTIGALLVVAALTALYTIYW